MLVLIKKEKIPEILVVTALYSGHKILRETKISLNRNDIKFDWVSFESSGNTAFNYYQGIKNYEKKFHGLPKYVILIDRDTIPRRNMLDKIHAVLNNTDDSIAYGYCDFEFTGAVNRKFNYDFNPQLLLRTNYISSNSMIKTVALEMIGGIIYDDKYKRLLDWCLWLKFLSYGYYGIRVKDTSFVNITTKDSVSAGDNMQYQTVVNAVREDFIKPLLSGLIY